MVDSNAQLDLRSYAHIGDAVYEVFIREMTIYKSPNPNEVHELTIALVNCEAQADVLNQIDEHLNEDEKNLARRARNLATKHKNQSAHRQATALEVLVGYWYINDKNRLDAMLVVIKDLL